MDTKERILQALRRNEAREWLDEMGIVISQTDLDDGRPEVEQNLEKLGIGFSEDPAPSETTVDDNRKRAA
jgi:hypothetical protein